MGCSHTDIKDKKSSNVPKLNDQNTNIKKLDENKTKNMNNHNEEDKNDKIT